ncbi:UV DNA damage repair endonuclease UvsE [Halobacillus sp. BAB-2008]|uniref:UV DNA damage repair endonuclease UvsE n=1 Tax=Halobacillus sp. BAB-2008 TaxID=1246484 RepID=UPI0002A4EEE6|nr:UV DNA damage repair endonuclease UvsE [Halobacillus sp. BAB-2008]ELK44668.1 UV damage endonuclease [Halobacillus sp. BAB-2008]
MTLFRLGYVAMSLELENASPSQTLTFKRFSGMKDREAALRKLESIAVSNIHNCLRILKHNLVEQIEFFRFSSRLVPLATHKEVTDWDYISSIKKELNMLGDYAISHAMRVDFHPDHFVVLNSPSEDVFRNSMEVLKHHYLLLHYMGIDPMHRCVLHLGGKYGDKEKSLERFLDQWAHVPNGLQKLVMIENDDTSFTLSDCLYICEKLGIPQVFDLHHHLANNDGEDWTSHWSRVIDTWRGSQLPVKMHISSPKSEKAFNSHADFIDRDMFLNFIKNVDGSTSMIDCMIEAKQKDQALKKLMRELQTHPNILIETPSTFRWKGTGV